MERRADGGVPPRQRDDGDVPGERSRRRARPSTPTSSRAGSDCERCHTTAAGGTLGLRTEQMNRSFAYGGVRRQSATRARAREFLRQLPAGAPGRARGPHGSRRHERADREPRPRLAAGELCALPSAGRLGADDDRPQGGSTVRGDERLRRRPATRRPRRERRAHRPPGQRRGFRALAPRRDSATARTRCRRSPPLMPDPLGDGVLEAWINGLSGCPLTSRSGNSAHKAARDFQPCRGATTTR